MANDSKKMKHTGINAVIFDIDGTLIDSVDLHARAWQEALRHFGFAVSFQAVRDQIGKGGDELLPTFLTEEQVAKMGEELKSWRGEHFKKNYLHEIVPFAGSHELLLRVKDAGKKLAAGSSAHKDELDIYIGMLNAKELFDVTTSSDDADKSKPHPDIFEAALAKLGECPENVVVIGDSPYDSEAASKVNLSAIGVLSGGFPREWLLQSGVNEIYQGPQDLLERFDESLIMRPQLALAAHET
jgi:HAD superfamily hydrolase (TIGR01549 family)